MAKIVELELELELELAWVPEEEAWGFGVFGYFA